MKPMLAVAIDFSKVRYPVYVSPKIDGIRCIVHQGVAMSRSWKPIPNLHVQHSIGKITDLEGLDGELVVGDATAANVYNRTMSGLMSEQGHPDFKFLVFDFIADAEFLKHYRQEYESRLLYLKMLQNLPPWVEVLPQALCYTKEDLDFFEESFITQGYEGAIVRATKAPYKQGRSTIREGYLLKMKRYKDAEAIVVGYEELLHNDNPAFTNELGRTAHTSHKANQRPGGTLGALVCKTIPAFGDSIEFKIGTGFDLATRKVLWNQRETLCGKVVKFKYMPHGQLDAPRHPVFLGFRHKLDM